MGAAQLQLHISIDEFQAAAAIRWTEAAGTGLSAGREAGQFRSPAAPGTFTKFVKARQRSGDVFGYRIGTKQLGAGLSTAGWSRLRIFVGRYPECGELSLFQRPPPPDPFATPASPLAPHNHSPLHHSPPALAAAARPNRCPRASLPAPRNQCPLSTTALPHQPPPPGPIAAPASLLAPHNHRPQHHQPPPPDPIVALASPPRYCVALYCTG